LLKVAEGPALGGVQRRSCESNFREETLTPHSTCEALPITLPILHSAVLRIREPSDSKHTPSQSQHHSFFSVKAVIQAFVKFSTTSGLRISLRNCSCCTRSKAFSVGPGYLSLCQSREACFKLLRAKPLRIEESGCHIREKRKIFGGGEVFQVLAPFDEGVIFKVFLHTEVVEVVGVGEGLNELGWTLVG
jgi:hypothetical protein